MTAEVQGHVEPGFERVQLAFADNFEQHGEVGAAFAAYVHGRLVVDIWGGAVNALRASSEITSPVVFFSR